MHHISILMVLESMMTLYSALSTNFRQDPPLWLHFQIWGDGELNIKLNFKVCVFSASAKEKLKAAGYVVLWLICLAERSG